MFHMKVSTMIVYVRQKIISENIHLQVKQLLQSDSVN